MKIRFLGGLAAGAVILFFTLANAQQEPPPDAQVDSTQPADVLPPDIESNAALSEVIRLSQAAVSEDIVTNYVSNSQYPFNLTANQIIYLKDIGLPDSVVMAMIQRDQQLGEAPPAPETSPAPPPVATDVTENYFYDSLAPYGSWVVVEGYGRCWRPSVVVYDSNWQPYGDHGHWVYTDAGWYWMSDYSWGWAPFHYGRWFHHERFGWCWEPDTVWAPSWVCWRYSNDYCGWAPLPPHCDYHEGVGLVFNGARVSVGFDFGLNVGAFTFVATRDFCDPHPWRHRVESHQATQVFSQTTVINNFNVDGHNHAIINHGIPPEHITAVTHAPIRTVTIHDTTTPVGRGEQIDRSGSLIVNRPHFNPTANVRNNNAPHTIPSPTTGRPMEIPPQNQNRNSNLPRRNQLPVQNRNLPQQNGTTPMPLPNQNDNRNFQQHNQTTTMTPQSPARTTTPQLPATPVQPPHVNQNPTPAPNRSISPTPDRNNNLNQEWRTVSPRQQQNTRPYLPPAASENPKPAPPVTPPTIPPTENRVQPQRNYVEPYNAPPVVRPNSPQPEIVQPQPQPAQPSNPQRPDRSRDKDKNGQ